MLGKAQPCVCVCLLVAWLPVVDYVTISGDSFVVVSDIFKVEYKFDRKYQDEDELCTCACLIPVHSLLSQKNS